MSMYDRDQLSAYKSGKTLGAREERREIIAELKAEVIACCGFNNPAVLPKCLATIKIIERLEARR